jgi:hypothetical protein
VIISPRRELGVWADQVPSAGYAYISATPTVCPVQVVKCPPICPQVTTKAREHDGKRASEGESSISKDCDDTSYSTKNTGC